MWFLYDAALLNIQQNDTNYLRIPFPKHWISRNACVPRKWPPRPPDLNPVDCYFWGLVKTLVYNVVEINDEDEF